MSASPRHVVVVGAGVVGLSTAWHLLKEGLDVTVVDRTGVAAGSSWGNAGWLAPALTHPLPDPAILRAGIRETLQPSSPIYVPVTAVPRLLRFLTGFTRHCTPARWREAMAVYHRVNRLSLEAFDELDAGGVTEPTQSGHPFVAAFTSDSDRAALVDSLRHVGDSGDAPAHELVTGEEARRIAPALGDAVQCGLLIHGQRFINPGRYVHALAAAVTARGGKILEHTDVERIVDRGAAGVEVRTGESAVRADVVVVATGAWLGRLSRGYGVRQVVQAGRGYSFTVRPEHVPTVPIYLPTQRVACTPWGDGLRVAGMMEFRRPDDPLDPRRVRAIVDAAKPMLGGIDWEARTDEWVGSRPCTTDGLPLIGATRSPRVFVSGGHGMWGIVLGPLSGRLLARQISRGERHDLLDSFDPLR